MYGKIKKITKADGSIIAYTYDAAGNRITKTTSSGTTVYVRDAQGNVLSIYEQKGRTDLTQTEVHLYGSSRLGIWEADRNVEYPEVYTYASCRRRSKIFEETDHRGNVQVTVSDAKRGIDDNGDGIIDRYEPIVVSAQDNYAFGMLMPARTQRSDVYRYGFNGKENDNDVKGGGNQQDYGFRIYDPRLGKFLSTDPLQKKYPELSTYQFASNSPIWGIDLDGAELRIHTEITGMTGHAFLTVGTSNETVVYTYGRYAGVYKTSGISSGALSPLGPGVLIKLTGDKAVKFVNDQLAINHSKIFEIKDADEKAAKNYMDNLFNSSNKIPAEGKYKNDPDAHIVGDYSLVGNSCVTKTIEGASASGTKLDFESLWNLIMPGATSTDPKMSPIGLQTYLDGKAGGGLVKDVTQQVKVENEIVVPVKLPTAVPATDHPEDTKWKKNVTRPVTITSSSQTNKTN